MKQKFAAAALALLISLTGACTLASAQVLSVRADSWPPFNDDPASAEPGYAVEILKAVFEPKGYKIDYATQPWSRVLADVPEGKFDAAIGASAAECPACIIPQEPIGMIDNRFYVKKGRPWTYQGLESLKGMKIGSIDGYDYGDDAFNAYLKQQQGTSTLQAMTGDDALQKNIQKLIAGRIDTFVECKPVVSYTLKKLGIDAAEVVEAGALGEATPAYIIFSPAKPDSKKNAALLDEGIRALRASGELRKILDKYNVNDWQ